MKYLVDIYVPYVKSVVVEAADEDAAQCIVQAGMERGDFDPRDFKPTEDSEDVQVYGEAEDDCIWPTYDPKDLFVITTELSRDRIAQVARTVREGDPGSEETDVIDCYASAEFDDGHVIDLMVRQGDGCGYLEARFYGDDGQEELDSVLFTDILHPITFADRGKVYIVNVKEED